MTRFRYHWKRGPALFAHRVCSRILGTPSDTAPQPQGRLDELILQMKTVNLAAFYQHVPSRYAGEIISIRASKEDDVDLLMSPGSGGWEAFAEGPIRTYLAPGDHSSMIRMPNATDLARLVEQQLDGAE
jgi:hypothetical protein